MDFTSENNRNDPEILENGNPLHQSSTNVMITSQSHQQYIQSASPKQNNKEFLQNYEDDEALESKTKSSTFPKQTQVQNLIEKEIEAQIQKYTVREVLKIIYENLFTEEINFKLYSQYLNRSKEQHELANEKSSNKVATKKHILTIQQLILEDVLEQIGVLNKVQKQAEKVMDMFIMSSNSSCKSGTKDEKWRFIVMSYKEKIEKLTQQIKSHEEEVKSLRKEVEFYESQANRVSHLNSMKVHRIENLILNIESKDEEIKNLNLSISNLEGTMNDLNEGTVVLKRKLQESEYLYNESILEKSCLENEINESMTVLSQKVKEINILEEEVQEKNRIQQMQDEFAITVLKMESTIEGLQIRIKDYEQEEQIKQYDEKNVQTEEQRNQGRGEYQPTHQGAGQLTQPTHQKKQRSCTLAEDIHQSQEQSSKLGKINQREDDGDENMNEKEDEDEFGLTILDGKHYYEGDEQRQGDILPNEWNVTSRKISQFEEEQFSEASQKQEESHELQVIEDMSLLEESSILSLNNHKYLTSIEELTQQLSTAYEEINLLKAQLAQLQKHNQQLREKESEMRLTQIKMQRSMQHIEDMFGHQSHRTHLELQNVKALRNIRAKEQIQNANQTANHPPNHPENDKTKDQLLSASEKGLHQQNNPNKIGSYFANLFKK